MSNADSISRCPASPLALDPQGVVDPQDFYAAVRNSAPMFVPEIDAWLVTRSADILEVASDSVRFSHRYPAGPHFARMFRESMARALAMPGAPSNVEGAATMGRGVLFASDPPDHARQRGVVAAVFSPRELKLIAVQSREIAHRLIDGFAGRDEVDLVSELAWPLPLEVIARRMGVPVEKLSTFRYWSDNLAKTLGGGLLSDEETLEILRALTEFHTYFGERLDEAAVNPQSDLLGLLARNAEKLSRQEMLGMLSQLLVAGHETTTALISALVLRLARDPELAERLRGDRSLIAPFVEEGLRLESPSQGTFRRANYDVEIGGVRIAGGDHIFLPFASVNRDPDRHAQADCLHLQRTGDPGHVAFGRGAHFCLGAPLARLNANIAIESILDRLTDIRLSGDRPYEYNKSYMVRCLSYLRLSFATLPGIQGR
ncbi:cytochrome P450 [Burkholderia orbicola]|uniref:cytochrome P450 n=1 Tax=Burkholderia orbicola TaxID=2978683 RepID=UPI0039A67F18